jgi:hypothetical protein
MGIPRRGEISRISAPEKISALDGIRRHARSPM